MCFGGVGVRVLAPIVFVVSFAPIGNDTPASTLQIHWFSIINSCVTVLLLTGFLSTILLRVLKNDFMKYTKDDEMGEDQV